MRRAVADGAVAIVDEGTGIDASWRIARRRGPADRHRLPGRHRPRRSGDAPERLPIAPTDHGTAFRLRRVPDPEEASRSGSIVDDSRYGQGRGEGARAVVRAQPGRGRDQLTVPAGAPDLAPQVLRARRAGATALLVWASRPRSPACSRPPAGRAGTSPSTRRPPARTRSSASSSPNRPDWVDGLTFAAGRPDRRGRPRAVLDVPARLRERYGCSRVGVKTPDGAEVDPAARLRDVRVRLRQRARRRDQRPAAARTGEDRSRDEPGPVAGANGDQRGFNENNHEGVVDDDVYFARFEGMTYSPVKDDPLSATLAVIDKRADVTKRLFATIGAASSSPWRRSCGGPAAGRLSAVAAGGPAADASARASDGGWLPALAALRRASWPAASAWSSGSKTTARRTRSESSRGSS